MYVFFNTQSQAPRCCLQITGEMLLTPVRFWLNGRTIQEKINSIQINDTSCAIIKECHLVEDVVQIAAKPGFAVEDVVQRANKLGYNVEDVVQRAIKLGYNVEDVIQMANKLGCNFEDVVQMASNPDYKIEDVVQKASKPDYKIEDVVQMASNPDYKIEEVVHMAAKLGYWKKPWAQKIMPKVIKVAMAILFLPGLVAGTALKLAAQLNCLVPVILKPVIAQQFAYHKLLNGNIQKFPQLSTDHNERSFCSNKGQIVELLQVRLIDDKQVEAKPIHCQKDLTRDNGWHNNKLNFKQFYKIDPNQTHLEKSTFSENHLVQTMAACVWRFWNPATTSA